MFMATLAAVTLAASSEAILVQTTFARLRQLAAESKSIRAEFTLTTNDFATERVQLFDGKFVMLRTKDDLFAKLEFHNRENNNQQAFVYRAGKVHVIDTASKSVTVFRPANVLRSAAKWVFPPVALLDDATSSDTYSWKIVMREKWYTHFDLKPQDPKSTRVPGRVVIVRRANDDIPVGLPRQLRQDLHGSRRTTWDFRSWTLNGKNPPSIKDFNVPTAKDGWKVSVMAGVRKDDFRLFENK